MKKQKSSSLHTVSKAQLEVWVWKDKAAESVAHLPVGERIRIILERAKHTSDKIQIQQKEKASGQPARVGG
ncbi:MAG: hypothetical protein IPM98_15270 [Lewinellaceae bacterium]|nr:hypothetical protein [Lewinellaceae bacterium]